MAKDTAASPRAKGSYITAATNKAMKMTPAETDILYPVKLDEAKHRSRSILQRTGADVNQD